MRFKPPAFIQGEALAEWRRIMRQGQWKPAHRAALAAYCTAYGRWADAEARVRETGGPITKTANGHDVHSLWLVVANRAFKQLHGMIRELGLSPARTKKERKKRESVLPDLGGQNGR